MIVQGIADDFKLLLLDMIAGDTFKLALYTAAATMNPASLAAYTPINETAGINYAAGGLALTIMPGFPQIQNNRAVIRFLPATWPPGSTFSYRGALIYNVTRANRAVMLLDFGVDLGPVAGTWTIDVPMSQQPPIVIH